MDKYKSITALIVVLTTILPIHAFASTYKPVFLDSSGNTYGWLQYLDTQPAGSYTITVYKGTYPDTSTPDHNSSCSGSGCSLGDEISFSPVSSGTGSYWIKIAQGTNDFYFSASYDGTNFSSTETPFGYDMVVTNLKPEMGSTTPNTFITSFNYAGNWNPSANEYSVCFRKSTNLLLTVASTTGACLTGQLSTNTGSITRTITLPEGVYGLTVHLYQNGGVGQNQNYDSPTNVFAVSTTTTYDSVITNAFPTLNATGTSTIATEIVTKLVSVLSEKVPFAWFLEIRNEYNTINQSGSSTLPKYSYDLHSLGIGSTTSLGNILPSFDILSSTTVRAYMSDNVYNGLMILQAAFYYILLVEYIWHRTRYFFRKT